MKLKPTLTILQIAAVVSAGVALTGCAPELNLKKDNDANLAAPNLTATPAELVVYPDDRPSIPDGAHTFKENCASCHGMTGSDGTAPVKFDMQWAHAIKPVDMYRTVAFGGTSSDPAKRTHRAFAGTLNTREMWNAVVYARSLGQPALTTEQLAAIDPVFGSNCAVCHGTKGDGDGPLARNLEPMPANFQSFARFFNRTDDVLFDHIANGIRWEGMPNFLGKKDSKKNITFDEAYIRQLVQYVHKFHVDNQPVLTANLAAPAKPKAAAPSADASKDAKNKSAASDNKPDQKHK